VVEPDGLALDRSLLVQPGEEEEVLHERAHAVALVRQAAHGLVELAGVPEPPGAPQVGVAPDRGEGRPQLVGGVGGEPAEARLGRLPLPERLLDLAQHRVERQPEPAGLGPVVAGVDPPREVAGGDLVGGRRHGHERPDAEAQHPPQHGGQRGEDGHGADQLDEPHAAQRRLHLVEVGGDHEQAVDPSGDGHRPPAAARRRGSTS
jgi:hypothetical protein